jgi:hypothetical protein
MYLLVTAQGIKLNEETLFLKIHDQEIPTKKPEL